MRRQLALLIVAALLPLSLVASFFEIASIVSARGGMLRQAADHARAVATLVSRELAADEREAQMVAASPAFDQGFDEHRFSLLADRLVAQEPHWHVISISNLDGMRLFDSPFPIGRMPHGRVIDLKSQQAAALTGRPVVGPMVSGPEKHPAFAVRAPVIRSGKVRYVVSIVVQPHSLKDLLVPDGLPKGWIARVLDSHGRVVVASDLAPGEALSPQEASLAVAAPNGSVHDIRAVFGAKTRSTWRDIPGTDWRVEVSMPPKAYDAPLVRGTEWLVAALGGATALAVLLGWLLHRERVLEGARNRADLDRQRLEALGRMTGGVAHDFNNLLTPILGGLDLILRRLAPDSPHVRLVDASLKSAERAKALVSRLLAFARRQTLQTEVLDVAGLLMGLEDLIRSSIGPMVELRLHPPQEPLYVCTDPNQLELAVLNLVVNANDAMAGDGLLTIRAHGQKLDRQDGDLLPGRYVRLEIADTGPGMTDAMMKLAIEPFFTTKAQGAGTGLGLSMVHGLAAQSGGALRLKSGEGEGLAAAIWLPAVEAPLRPHPAPSRASGTAGRPARILLVDDDEAVRTSTAEILRDHGHDIVEAGSAAHAMHILRAEAAFDLLLTDFVMPGGSGADLVRDARALIPGIPAMVLTGYFKSTDDLPADVAIMAKPYRRDQLINQVQVHLETSSAL